MKKQVVIKILCVLLYVLIVCALSALFAYKEWSTMLFITVIFLPFPLLLTTENALVRVIGLFGFWAVLIVGVLYFNSLFTHIIIVKGKSSYTIEKVRKEATCEYSDSKGNTKSIVVQGNCVLNQIDKPLRLYQVTYSRYQPMFGGSGEKDIMEIPAYSMVAIPNYPNYILESPPNSIMVKKHGVFSGDEKAVKTVLEVVEY